LHRSLAIKLTVFLILFGVLSWKFSSIVLYIIISIVIFAILRPLTKYLSNARFFNLQLPKIVAIIVSFSIFCGVILLFILLFVPLVKEQVAILGSLNYDLLFQRITTPISSFELFLIDKGVLEVDPGYLLAQLEANFKELVVNIRFSNILNSVVSITGNLFVGSMAVLFITFFFLYEMGDIKMKFASIIPNKYFEISMVAFNKIEKLLSNYLIGLIIQMVAVFSLASLGLSILGVKYAMTIAVFAAVANIIPYLGPLLGATFGILVGISVGNDFNSMNDYLILILKISSVFSVVQISDNLLFQPLIFSKSIKAHPLEIFISIFAGASLAGIPGMIAAIPVYTIIRVSFQELYGGYKQYEIVKL